MAKLVACKGCGNQVSVAAKSCPNCGHSVRRPVGFFKIVKIIGMTFVVLMVVSVIAVVVDKKDATQASRSTSTSDSPPSNEPAPAAPVNVSATKLARDYEANEVSADAIYRGKVLRVSGVVDSIKKDVMDDPYVVLRTANQFMGVHADFEDNTGLARLARGKKITVRCIGNNVIIGSPMLKDCVLE